MPSTPLTDAIVALTTYANTVTGESDATLSAAVETLADGYGSGGGGLELLEELTVTNQNAIQIDMKASWFTTYATVLIIPDLTTETSDWLYLSHDATTGGSYSAQGTHFGHDMPIMIHLATNSKYAGAWIGQPGSSGNASGLADVVSYLYWRLYNSAHLMSGSVKIYAITV